MLAASFRKNKNYAVWDDRGLTIRIGKVAKSTRLESVPTSPKAFDREEILSNAQAIQKGTKSRGAIALSGSKRVGNLAFFLVRWEDQDRQPWMEALVSVDLVAETFHPKFHARMLGISLADKPIDDRLFILDNRLSSIVRMGEQWGLASFDPEQSKFVFREAGRKLESYQPLTMMTGAFVEETGYGSRLGGRIDLATMARKTLVEAKGKIRFTDKGSPLLAMLSSGNDSRLINTDTGAELNLLGSAALRRTRYGLVVWSPFRSPKRAWLYDPERWSVLAEWSGGN